MLEGWCREPRRVDLKRAPSWKMRDVTRKGLNKLLNCKSEGWRFESRGRRDCFFFWLFSFFQCFLFCFVLFVCLFFN